MTDLRQRLHELDQLEAPDMRAAIEARAQQLRAASTGARHRDVVVVAIGALETDRSERRWLPYVVLAAAAVIVAVVSIALFGRTEQSSPIDVIDGPADVDQPEPTVSLADATLTGIRGIRSAADSVWAWDESQIWRYRNGAWAVYSSTPSPPASAPKDLAHDGDTLWVLTEDGDLLHLDSDEWVAGPEAPSEAWNLEADPRTGTVWISAGGDLHRSDGEVISNVGNGPAGYHIMDFAVTEDGSVWASGNFWGLGGVAHYDDTTSSWEVVRPLGGDQDMPAYRLATTRDGGLWAMLADWTGSIWMPREAAGEPGAVWALAHRDGATGDWTVHDEGLADRFPLTMAADTDVVWLAQGDGTVADFQPTGGVSGFDGHTWTHHLEATSVADIAVAPDETIWVTTDSGDLHRFEP